MIEDVKRNKKVVNQFYKEEFDKLNKKSKQCLNDIFNLQSKEREIANEINKYELEIKKIKDDQSNHVNNNPKNRLKDSLVNKIFYYENEIEKLKLKLDWTKQINKIEKDYLKRKYDLIMKKYDKLYQEKLQIDEDIGVTICGEAIGQHLGEIIAAKVLQEENDRLYQNVMNNQ